jgi:hypothetical protein
MFKEKTGYPIVEPAHMVTLSNVLTFMHSENHTHEFDTV